MPIYDYHCKSCGPFDALRPMAERDLPATCPACTQASTRIWVQGPRLSKMKSERFMAMEINERASHEPKHSVGYAARSHHSSGGSCCSPGGRRSATAIAAKGAKAFPSRRPWMISH